MCLGPSKALGKRGGNGHGGEVNGHGWGGADMVGHNGG